MGLELAHPARERLLVRVTAACWPLVVILVVTLATLQHNQREVWCRAPPPDTPVRGDDLGSSAAAAMLRTLSPPRDPAECAVFAEYGRNYLTPVDLVVKNAETNNVCIRARFAISIRVEEAQGSSSPKHGGGPGGRLHTQRPILGYVPLEHVLAVEESCPDSVGVVGESSPDEVDATKKPPTNGTDEQPPQQPIDHSENKQQQQQQRQIRSDDEPPGASDQNKVQSSDNKTTTTITTKTKPDEDELELIVTFECGKLSFTFKRDHSKVYVSAIRGMVKLDKRVVREFIAIRPMFLTSDLGHHFKYDDEIEVVSEVQSGAHILTAMFYFTEIEAFRESTSRDFVKPPDEKSKPFPETSGDDSDEQAASQEEQPHAPHSPHRAAQGG